MIHDRDFVYKGHEVVIMHDFDGYIYDVRADDFEGEMIKGVFGLSTEKQAIKEAMAYIDGLKTLPIPASLIDDLECAVSFETDKEPSDLWTMEYKAGYIDGLKQAISTIKQYYKVKE